MKLSNVFAKLTSKSNVVRTLAVTTLAGAALLAATPAAQAQHVAFGVQFGAPAYYAPAPAYYGYDHNRWEREQRERFEAQRRYDEMRAREAYRFHHDEFRHDDHFDGRFDRH
jgi:hypothetical protein